jgi:hypothetical protein
MQGAASWFAGCGGRAGGPGARRGRPVPDPCARGGRRRSAVTGCCGSPAARGVDYRLVVARRRRLCAVRARAGRRRHPLRWAPAGVDAVEAWCGGRVSSADCRAPRRRGSTARPSAPRRSRTRASPPAAPPRLWALESLVQAAASDDDRVRSVEFASECVRRVAGAPRADARPGRGRGHPRPVRRGRARPDPVAIAPPPPEREPRGRTRPARPRRHRPRRLLELVRLGRGLRRGERPAALHRQEPPELPGVGARGHVVQVLEPVGRAVGETRSRCGSPRTRLTPNSRAEPRHAGHRVADGHRDRAGRCRARSAGTGRWRRPPRPGTPAPHPQLEVHGGLRRRAFS